MTMKFYGSPTHNVHRAILPLFLAEVDIEKEVEFVKVNLMARQQMTPAYKSKQIFGVVPVLEDGDVSVFESRAIARYIAEKYEAECPTLLGKNLHERAKINTWCESEAHNVNPIVAPLIKEVYFAEVVQKRPVNEEMIRKGKEELCKVLDAYEVQLSKNKYIAGETYTLADAFHTPQMYKVKTMPAFEGVFDSRPHVSAWADEITSLPAFQKCLQPEHWDKATPFQV